MADTEAVTEEAPAEQESPDLGDAGKKAIAEERSARKAAERAAKQASAELDKLREQSMSEQEKAIAAARKETEKAVRAELGKQIVSAKLAAAATGRLADPDDALAFIDTTELEDDPASIAAALDALIERKPHLAASAKRSSGFDAGARGTGTPNDMNAIIRRQAGRR